MLSLRSFHLLFLAAAIVVSAGFGVWACFHAHLVPGILSLAVGIALVVYGAYFAGKTERIDT